MSLQTVAMCAASVCYLTATVGYVIDKQFWMAATLFFYALSILTVYMAGTR